MKRFFDDVIKYYAYEVRAAKSSLKTEVANSYLNWIWWVLDPLLSMMVYYLIFGIVFKAKEQYFIPFLFIGQTMWGFFSKNVQQSVRMIKRNKPIVSKVYIPKFVLLISNMMINGFKMMISCVIVILMMLVFRVDLSYYVFCCIPIFLVMFFVTFAISVNLMHFGVFIEDLGNVINIVMQLLFYMTGIMYNIDTRLGPDYPLAAKLLTYGNPMAFLIRDMRNVLLYRQGPDWLALILWGAAAVVLSMIGIHTIYKNENSYVKVI
ncbi:MAG: ABC transporter permease [Clostridium sp.]|nr:ABC transporter permease [Clostridium sp.]